MIIDVLASSTKSSVEIIEEECYKDRKNEDNSFTTDTSMLICRGRQASRLIPSTRQSHCMHIMQTKVKRQEEKVYEYVHRRRRDHEKGFT